MPWSRSHVEPEGDDTIGHPWRHVSPIDEDKSVYLVEVDSDEDVTGQGFSAKGLSPEDDGTEGQRRP